MLRRALCAVLVVVLWGRAFPGPARAQAPDFATARRHYVQATELEKQGDHGGAAREYAIAYDLTKDPLLFYKIARAYERSGDKDAALVYYRRYVNEVTQAQDREEVERHMLTLEAPATQPATTQPSSAPLELAPPEDIPPPPTFVDRPSRWERSAAWISVGAATVLLTTGALFSASASSRHQDLEILGESRDAEGRPERPERYDGQVREDYADAVAEGEKFEKWALYAFASAGASAVMAGVFFVLDATRPAPSLAPVVTPTAAGLSAQWRF